MMKRFLLWIYQQTQKTLLTNEKWHLCHNTNNWILRQNNVQMNAKCVYFRAPYSTRHSRRLNSNRKDKFISLIRPGQSAQVLIRFARQKSLGSLAASPKWQSHVPKIGAGGAASFHETHRLITPRQKLTDVHQKRNIMGWTKSST